MEGDEKKDSMADITDMRRLMHEKWVAMQRKEEEAIAAAEAEEQAKRDEAAAAAAVAAARAEAQRMAASTAADAKRSPPKRRRVEYEADDGVRAPDAAIRERLVYPTLHLPMHMPPDRPSEEFAAMRRQREEPRAPPLCRCTEHVWARGFVDGTTFTIKGESRLLFHDMTCNELRVLHGML